MSDGTSQGTRMLKDITPGPGGSVNADSVVYKGAVYFVANDGLHGSELWKSDGTEGGTVLVADVNPGSQGSVHELVIYRNEIAFIADDGVHGSEIWTSDGTTQGTRLAFETVPGPGSLYPYDLFVAGDMLYFTAYDPDIEEALWRTDGTQAGTIILTDSTNADSWFSANDFVALGNRVFFRGDSDAAGYEPWISDGTVAGTHMIKDIRPGYNGSFYYGDVSAALGGFVYFSASDGVHGEDLYRTDGTEAGTVLVKDINPGSSVSGIGSMVVLDGTLYLTAGPSAYHANQLWKSDGTEQGTVPVATDLGGFWDALDASTGALLFSAWDPDHGFELWRSDGTTRGTVLVQDLYPGLLGSQPRGFAALGDRVYFAADDRNAGIEPWVARSAIVLARPEVAIRDLINDVWKLGLPFGISTSLGAKLDAAAQAVSRGRTGDALRGLEAFDKSVDAMTPRWIAPAAAADLKEFATEIAGLLDPIP